MSISLFRNANSFRPMSSLTVAAHRESISHGPLGGGGGGCPVHEQTKKLTAPFVFINIPTFQAAADAFRGNFTCTSDLRRRAGLKVGAFTSRRKEMKNVAMMASECRE